MSKTHLAACAIAAAFLALAFSPQPAHATGGGGNSQIQFCYWYKQQAMNTGDEYWWRRWRTCIRGGWHWE